MVELSAGEPVRGRILTLVEGRRAEIDVGSAQGLRAGMLMTAVDGNDWIDVIIRSVEPDRSVVEAEEGHKLTKRHRVTSRP